MELLFDVNLRAGNREFGHCRACGIFSSAAQIFAVIQQLR